MTTNALEEKVYTEVSSAESDISAATEKNTLPPVPMLTTLTLTFISFTEGLMIGYMETLMSLFRERQTKSEDLGLLSLMVYPYAFCFLGAPIVDRYYSASFGKRKTYIVPCKMYTFLGLLLLSFFIEDAVKETNFKFIGVSLCCISLIQLLNMSAVSGLRFEVYGPERVGMATFTLVAGWAFGSSVSYDVFTLLNSKYFVNEVLNMKDSQELITHRTGLIFAALCNLAVALLTLCIKEQREDKLAHHTPKLSTWKLVKFLFTDSLHKLPMIWIIFSLVGVMAILSTIPLQLIQRGFRREHIVLIQCANAPLFVIGNLIMSKVMKPGKILQRCAIVIIIKLLCQYIDLYNVSTFSKDINYSHAFALYCISIFMNDVLQLESFQMAFIGSIAYKKYSATFVATFAGITALGKLIPISIAVSLLDYINYNYMFVLVSLANLAFIVLTYGPVAKKADSVPVETYNASLDKSLNILEDYDPKDNSIVQEVAPRQDEEDEGK